MEEYRNIRECRSIMVTPDAPKTVLKRPRYRGAWLMVILVVLLFGGWWFEVPKLWLRSFADRALREYHAHEALIWIERGERYYPNDQALYLLAARSHLQLNRNVSAIEWLDRAKDKGASPDALEPYRLMAEAQRGNQVALENLLGRTNASLEAYEALIRGYAFENQSNKANLILDQMEQSGVAPTVVLYHRGRIREISEDFAEASRFYSEAFKKDPSSGRAAFRAGICFYQLRDFDRSEVMFNKVQMGPYKEVFAIERASCLWEKNAFDEAARAIAPPLEILPSKLHTLYFELDEFIDSDRAALVAARIEDARGNHQLAVALLERVLAFNNREFDARGLLIKNLRALGRTREADEVTAIQTQMVAYRQRCRQLRLELDSNPRDVAKLCELAELYWYAESDAEALLAISEILELEPKCERALLLQGKIMSSQASRQFPRSSATRP